MTAARAVGVAVGTGITAVVLVVLFDRIIDVYDANAGVAGAFLLSDCRHGFDPSGFQGFVMVVVKEVLNHDLQDAVHASIGHRVKDLLATSVRLQDPRRP